MVGLREVVMDNSYKDGGLIDISLVFGMGQFNVFLYNLYTMSRIETKIIVRVYINVCNIFLEGQGHWVKSQGQSRDFVENLFGL